jgi:hypothetical protein
MKAVCWLTAVVISEPNQDGLFMINMTTKEELHQLVDELPGDQTELAQVLLEDLRDAADTSASPLDEESLASLDRGLADIAAGRVKLLDEYNRERGR